jgi:hypothetical protein
MIRPEGKCALLENGNLFHPSRGESFVLSRSLTCATTLRALQVLGKEGEEETGTQDKCRKVESWYFSESALNWRV